MTITCHIAVTNTVDGPEPQRLHLYEQRRDRPLGRQKMAPPTCAMRYRGPGPGLRRVTKALVFGRWTVTEIRPRLLLRRRHDRDTRPKPRTPRWSSRSTSAAWTASSASSAWSPERGGRRTRCTAAARCAFTPSISPRPSSRREPAEPSTTTRRSAAVPAPPGTLIATGRIEPSAGVRGLLLVGRVPGGRQLRVVSPRASSTGRRASAALSTRSRSTSASSRA